MAASPEHGSTDFVVVAGEREDEAVAAAEEAEVVDEDEIGEAVLLSSRPVEVVEAVGVLLPPPVRPLECVACVRGPEGEPVGLRPRPAVGVPDPDALRTGISSSPGVAGSGPDLFHLWGRCPPSSG